jgi:hypothetical protein
MKTQTYLCAAALPFLLLSCTSLTHDHIKSHQWFHGQGYNIGDRLAFDDKTYTIRQDTILRSDLPVAVVVYSSGDLLGSNNDITILSLATGEEGLYHEK